MEKNRIGEGVNLIVRNIKRNPAFVVGMVLAAVFMTACSGDPVAGPDGTDPNEVAAKVNGRDIRMEEVEKAVKAQAQGTQSSFSPLELASARLSVLQQIIQTEVMYQKAEKESTIPSDDEVTAEMNKRKTASALSVEEFEKQMKEAGETEQSWRENVKKEIALQRLQEKIAGKVDSPKDVEIEQFYNGNKEQFKNKRGAELAAIVIDPSNSGQGDTTTNEDEVRLRLNEIGQRLATTDFAAVAREFSEDLETRARGGDWRYFSEDEMRQVFGAQVAAHVMEKMTNGQVFPSVLTLDGRFLVVKLLRKQEKDEDLTLESPQVRPRITELLTNARKNLLWQSYVSLAMNESKVENLLARKVVANPNELSGARPAAPANANQADANANTNANANTAANGNANVNSNADAAANTNTAANSDANANK